MRILLLGANGQLGWELQRALSPLGPLTALDMPDVDLANIDELRRIVRGHAPTLIVNAAAYTAVDRAEREPDLAMAVNGRAPGVLAEECKRLGALLIHYSTDYIFDGCKDGFYVEEDAPNPLSTYGRTKLAGERAIEAVGTRHLTVRTSWVYAPRGQNFAKTILRLAKERDELAVVADQVGAPTSAELLADVTARCVSRSGDPCSIAQGTYHLVAKGEISWHGYATFLVQTAAELGWPLKLMPAAIKPIPASEYPLPATRPANSRLSTDKLSTGLGIELPHWRVHAKRLLLELGYFGQT